MYTQQRGYIVPATLAASALMGLLTTLSYFVVSYTDEKPLATISISPNAGVVSLKQPFSVTVLVTANTPVNVFSGDIYFDPDHLQVSSIDYNTSIADLWAKTPWYQNGAGTINFAGGTTKPGGFVGDGTLITIAFTPIKAGDARVQFKNAEILAHDGFGTNLPINSLQTNTYFITDESISAPREPKESIITVRNSSKIGDLNNDGKVTIVDISQGLAYFTINNLAGDVNGDGRVSLADISVIMGEI